MSKQILVLGSTGKTGKRVAERLRQLNIEFRPGSRNAQPAFDWDEPGTWQDVLAGIETVYITFQPDFTVPHAYERIKLFTETAKINKVKKLVLLSGRGEKEAEACEQLIIQSGLEWTIIRASWFMQNFSESFFLDAILNNEMTLPVITALEPFVDADDIADVAVKALIDNKHNGRIYELTGSELLSFESATAKIAKGLNRQIAYTEMSMDAYATTLRSYQVPEDVIWVLQYLFTEVLDGRNASTVDDIEKVLGRKPTTFGEYVSKCIHSGVWNTK